MFRLFSAVALALLLQAVGPHRASAQSFTLEESWNRDFRGVRSCTTSDPVYGVLCAESVIQGPLRISGNSSVVDPPFPAPPTPTFRIHMEWKYGADLYTTGGVFVRFEGLHKICDGSGRPTVYGYGPPGRPNQILVYDPLFSTRCTETYSDSQRSTTTVTDTLGLEKYYFSTEACDERMRDGDYCANSTWTQDYQGHEWTFHCEFRVYRAPLWPGVQPLVDLSVGYPTLTQVVPNPDISDPPDNRVDLVADREALLRVSLFADHAASTDTRPVTVQLKVEGQADPILPWKSEDRTLRVNSLGPVGRNIEFLFKPIITGPQSLVVTVDPGHPGAIEEADETNNAREMQIDVKRTNALAVGYIRVRSPNDPYDPVNEQLLNEWGPAATLFMRAIFPVSHMLQELNPNLIRAAADNTDQGMAEDIVKVTRALIRTNDRAIGFVTADYFDYHGAPGAVGATFCSGVLGGLARPGAESAPAHEIGHTFDMTACSDVGKEEYRVKPDGSVEYAGNPVTGFFVPNPDGPGSLEIKDRICFMGTAGPPRTNWVDWDHYAELFKTLTVDKSDPEVLVVTGLLWEDGRLEFRPWSFQQEGVPSTSQEGNVQVRVLDAVGQVLNETGLRVTFKVVEQPVGVRPTDVVPLVVKVPFPSSATTVEIIRDGQSVVKTDPLSKLLRDAVSAIPEGAFVADHIEQGKALMNKVEAFEKMVAKGHILPALNKLQNDVRPHVESWLIDYQPSEPLQTTKEGLLQLIDTLIARLQSRL